MGPCEALIENAAKCHSEDLEILQDDVFFQLATDSQLLSAEVDEEPAQHFYATLVDFINTTTVKNAEPLNASAWRLVTSPNVSKAAAQFAVILAKKGTEVAPTNGNIENTLGVAQYRAENWQAAMTALNKSIELRHGGDAEDYFFLAMTLERLGKRDEARPWFEKGVEWTKNNDPENKELQRFQEEATDVLGVAKPKSSLEQQTP